MIVSRVSGIQWFFFVVIALLARPLGGQTIEELLTRAELTDFVETTSYEEVIALSESLAELSDNIHLTTFGYTNEGRALPLLVVGAPDASVASVLGTGKTRVYVQGNIHGGEVCGKEALLMLLRRYAMGVYPSWTDELVLLIAPIYNADGNERVSLRNRPRQHGPIGGMGQRPNAQGLDLNRDHTKLDSPEARSLVRLMTEYDPHVAVDLHTTNGTRHAYHLTYSPPLHPNTSAAIDGLLRDRWLPEITRLIKEKHGWDYYYYGNVGGRGGGSGWRTFDHRPRFNNNYVGLRNRVAILSEAYAYASFEDRVLGSLWFVEEVLDYAEQNAAEIREIVETVDLESVVGTELATRADFNQSETEVMILMGEVDEVRHPNTGEIMLLRRDISIPTQMYEYGTFRPSEIETAPEAYYVLPEGEAVIERLEAHGITVLRYTTERERLVQRFQIDSTRTNPNAFQGRNERTVWGEWVLTTETLPVGTAYVSVDQPLGRLAFTLLEPRSDDGFVSWAILDDEIEGGRLPILRESPEVR
ncbi:MAG: M14 family metallopeptidase [Gemmatimonadetes bacterium]|nr:M14 family metallopeptidase [Gemmatimonadota bacterium]